jgi:hypothetical protein
VELSGRQQRLEGAMHVVGLRDDEESGCVAIKTMDDPGSPRVLAPRCTACECLGERAGAVPSGGVHDDARWLVDHHQITILVGDRERHRLWFLRSRPRLNWNDLDPLTHPNLVALGQRATVDTDRPCLDHARGLGP